MVVSISNRVWQLRVTSVVSLFKHWEHFDLGRFWVRRSLHYNRKTADQHNWKCQVSAETRRRRYYSAQVRAQTRVNSSFPQSYNLIGELSNMTGERWRDQAQGPTLRNILCEARALRPQITISRYLVFLWSKKFLIQTKRLRSFHTDDLASQFI